MIKINPNLKNNPMINEKTLPLLFQKNYDTGTYEQVKDFDWNWDGDNIVIETTLSLNNIEERKKLKENISLVLHKQKALLQKAISIQQKKLDAIVKIINGEDDNGL